MRGPRIFIPACAAAVALVVAAVPGLTRAAIPAPAASAVPGQIIVRFAPSVSDAQRLAVHARRHGVVVERSVELGADLVRVTGKVGSALAAYDAEPSVLNAEPNLVGHVAAPPALPNDPVAAMGPGTAFNVRQWVLTRANVPSAWRLAPGAYFTASNRPRTALKVAVLDTWVDVNHQDFANAGGSSRDAARGGQLALADAHSLVPSDRLHGSQDWHGTFIAGIVGAAANNRRDVAGVAYGARIMPVTVADGEGAVTAYRAAQGILWASGRGAKVINASFAIGATSSSDVSTIASAIDIAARRGAVVVAAAGNYLDDRTVAYPAAFAASRSSVIAVSASSALDGLAYCSGYNSYVTVAAPGQAIWSLDSKTGRTRNAPCATSTAAALVSGAAAMIAWRFGASIAPATIRNRIAANADDLLAAGRDKYTGYGRINVERALWSGPGPVTTGVSAPTIGPSNLTTVTAIVRSPDGVAGAELLLNSTGLAGTGMRAVPADGAWGETVERVNIRFSTQRAEGVYDLLVRGRDRFGRWGPSGAGVLIVDRSAPLITDIKTEPAYAIPGQKTIVKLTLADPWARGVFLTIELLDATDVVVARFTCAGAVSGTYQLNWYGWGNALPPCVHRAGPRSLTPGRYRIRIGGVDEARNTGSGEGTVLITTTAPSTASPAPTPLPTRTG